MATEFQARDCAAQLSEEYHDSVWRVYRTPSGNHWTRDDPEPMAEVYGIPLVHIAAYLNGKQVRP